jgi:hypothetical protein
MHKNSLRYADYVVAPGSDMYEVLVKGDMALAERLHKECLARDVETLRKAKILSSKSFDNPSE